MTRGADGAADALKLALSPGMTVLVGDGTGCPLSLLPALVEAIDSVGDIRLVFGWMLAEPPMPAGGRPPEARMVGKCLSGLVQRGLVEYVPARLGTWSALLHGAIRPDVVLLSAAPSSEGGLAHGTEVGWIPTAMDVADRVFIERNRGLPRTGAVPFNPLAREVAILADVDRPPISVPTPSLSEPLAAIGASVARLIPPGASVQVGPGAVGAAVLGALSTPVRVRTGVLTDAVVDLDDRGLLLDVPIAAYVAGTARLYEWAHERALTHGLDVTHDPVAMREADLYAVNTALEIDLSGQVDAEWAGDRLVGGIGGHPDFAAAASAAVAGLSVMALPSVHRGRSTLVARLSNPATTSGSDVDVVVTELGQADLRGCTRRERSARLRSIFPDVRDA